MIQLVIMLVIIGVALYLLEAYVPMDPTIKVVIRAVVAICVVLWLLNAFGVVDIPVPRVR